MSNKIMKILENAVLEQRSGNYEAAKALYFKVIQLNGRVHQAHNNVGLILLNEQLIPQAIEHFKKAVRLDRNNLTYLTNLASALERDNNHKESFEHFSIALKLDKSSPFILTHYLITGLKSNLTNTVFETLFSLGQIHVPEILIHTILVTYSYDTKSDTRLVNSLGAVYQFFSSENNIPKKMQLGEIKLPKSKDNCILIDLIDKLNLIGFFNSTIDHLLSLLDFASCTSRELQFLSLQGTHYQRLGDSSKSLHYFQQAHSLNPKDKVIQSKLCLAYAYCGMHSKAFELATEHNLTNMVSVYLLLTNRDFKNAWKTYLSADVFSQKNPPIKPFSNDDIPSKSILVYRFQGIGDEIMFLSCLFDLLDRAPKSITIECSSRLEALIKRSFPEKLKVVAIDEYQDSSHDFEWLSNAEPFDEALNISSLPLYFRNSIADFQNARHGYLKPDIFLKKNWRERLSALPCKFKIGFAWKGGVNFRRGIQKEDLHLLEDLFSHPNICWINMQYGDIEYEKDFFQNEFHTKLYEWDDIDYKNDIDQMAALISELDLLIQINNTSLHLAGAIGKEAWTILLHSSFDIRWFPLSDSSDCAWYPSVRLFRQNESETLESLLSRINISLTQWLEKHD